MEAVTFPSQSTFVHALSESSHPSLFSGKEKRVLLGLCVGAFFLPLIISLVILKQSVPSVALKPSPNQVAYLKQRNLMQGSDELAMAEIFLGKAITTSNPNDKQQYISEAQALVALISPTSENQQELNALNQKVALAANATSPQRIAAPASINSSVLAGETSSNASSSSVIMKTGSQKLFVPYAALTDKAQIYLTLSDNRNNAVIYISTRETGKGFTLASTAPLVQDIVVTWYEITP